MFFHIQSITFHSQVEVEHPSGHYLPDVFSFFHIPSHQLGPGPLKRKMVLDPVRCHNCFARVVKTPGFSKKAPPIDSSPGPPGSSCAEHDPPPPAATQWNTSLKSTAIEVDRRGGFRAKLSGGFVGLIEAHGFKKHRKYVLFRQRKKEMQEQ